MELFPSLLALLMFQAASIESGSGRAPGGRGLESKRTHRRTVAGHSDP